MVDKVLVVLGFGSHAMSVSNSLWGPPMNFMVGFQRMASYYLQYYYYKYLTTRYPYARKGVRAVPTFNGRTIHNQYLLVHSRVRVYNRKYQVVFLFGFPPTFVRVLTVVLPMSVTLYTSYLATYQVVL